MFGHFTTLCMKGLTQEVVIIELEETSSVLFKWFNNNYMKVNKSHLLISEKKLSQVLTITASSLKIYMNSSG